MTLPDEIRRLLSTPAPPDLGPGPRPGIQTAADIKALLGRCDVLESRRDLARAALLLWHDHLDDAHGIVQEMEPTAAGGWQAKVDSLYAGLAVAPGQQFTLAVTWTPGGYPASQPPANAP